MASQSSQGKNAPAIQNSGNPIQAFQREMNDLFQSFFAETLPHLWRSSEAAMPFGIGPATDVIETDKDFKITAELPGMDAENISVTVNDGYVTIKGEKEEEAKEEKNGYFRQERSFGEFQRVIALPQNMADLDKAEANMNKGVLMIRVPKKTDARSKARKLDVKQAA